MDKVAPRVVIFAMGLILVIISAGFAINSPTEAPKQGLDLATSQPGTGAARTHNVNLTAQGAYPDDMSAIETVKSWFGVDIRAERSAAHRAAELRKLQLRAKGHKTYNTRTKGVLYNGS